MLDVGWGQLEHKRSEIQTSSTVVIISRDSIKVKPICVVRNVVVVGVAVIDRNVLARPPDPLFDFLLSRTSLC